MISHIGIFHLIKELEEGILVQGELVDNWLERENEEGEFKHMASTFRHWIMENGEAGSSGDNYVKAESGRYYCYIVDPEKR
ncbi:MAG: hypothetical protein KZQ70_03945 [gamma proteobacterium symbiont of Lucinoma myriamae]|nr:hypothetical protein [gamma proteobacterium symbiont of Lucinoma myriamae]MCU7817750.1 hypothetical protein [gamma proteobacterium symbiont of Lucinoma myriamae]MCU7831731.1 hypothetical protein [gamma proteobacterium symbiont of Lucinoma myriamae]